MTIYRKSIALPGWAQYIVPITQSEIERRLSELNREHSQLRRGMSSSVKNDDPTKMMRNAPENAASVASLLLPTECIIAEGPSGRQRGIEP